MDNGLVFCVGIFRRVGKTIISVRKRPRIKANNKGCVYKVWGNKGKVKVFISRLIHDFL